jgi:hypothetical protein
MGRPRTKDGQGKLGDVLKVRNISDERKPVDGRRTKLAKTEKCRGCGCTIAAGCGWCGECLCEEDGL